MGGGLASQPSNARQAKASSSNGRLKSSERSSRRKSDAVLPVAEKPSTERAAAEGLDFKRSRAAGQSGQRIARHQQSDVGGRPGAVEHQTLRERDEGRLERQSAPGWIKRQTAGQHQSLSDLLRREHNPAVLQSEQRRRLGRKAQR